MSDVRRSRSRLIAGGSLALLAGAFVVLAPRLNPPEPQVDSYLISAGSVSRAIIHEKSSRGRSGRFSPPYLPHHLDFESTQGTIDVYVLRFPAGEANEAIDEMLKLTDQLAAGRPPETFVAAASGAQGRIPLGGWWPYGRTRYLVLIRSEKESEVRLITRYAP
ncbi:MAG: hypothetical protein ACT4QC_20190 [Planctomycetaceae bacterium]